MSLASKLSILKDRAQMFQTVREFFSKRHVLEVDCPALSIGAPIDVHIDVMKVCDSEKTIGYLHTSPEYGMKRLLAHGSGDIYQMSRVFRSGEVGPLHNPEFTMVEWYRLHLSFPELIQETLDFIRLFLGNLPVETYTYRQAFQQFAQIDYLTATPETLLACAEKNQISLSADAQRWDKDTLLNILMNSLVEPSLGQGKLTVILDFPSTQAALSKIENKNGELVAKRFEVYYQGKELANGYDELCDGSEQRSRFLEANQKREQLGKEALPLDEFFLQALELGLPSCRGVAVGFDRLMLLRHQREHLKDVIPFAWTEI